MTDHGPMTPSMVRAHAALDELGVAPGPLADRIAAEGEAHRVLDELGIEAGALPDRVAANAARLAAIDPALA